MSNRRDVISYVPDLAAYRARLGLHYNNDIGLKSRIKFDKVGYWFEPFSIGVKYLDNESLCCTALRTVDALGIKDENGNTVRPNLIDAVNINPTNGQYEPVIIELSIGDMRTDNPFNKLDEDEIALVRRFHPETISYTDEETGEQVIINQPLWWGFMS